MNRVPVTSGSCLHKGHNLKVAPFGSGAGIEHAIRRPIAAESSGRSGCFSHSAARQVRPRSLRLIFLRLVFPTERSTP